VDVRRGRKGTSSSLSSPQASALRKVSEGGREGGREGLGRGVGRLEGGVGASPSLSHIE
jgi:hypothetical protein